MFIGNSYTYVNDLPGVFSELSSSVGRHADCEMIAGGGMRFIVNDNTVYTSTADFKSPTNRERFATLQRTKAEADGMAEKLDAMRREYSSADARTQRRTAPVIVKAERQLEKLREYIREAEKEIRNTENMLINNGR